jgi:hypothetical protein
VVANRPASAQAIHPQALQGAEQGVNDSAAPPEYLTAWIIAGSFCFGGLIFIFELWRRFRREQTNPRPALWTIPKILFAALFLGYGTYSLMKGDAVIPLRHSHLHLRGMAALLVP